MNSRPMNPRIVALSGPLKGQVFPITETPLTFGRAEDNSVCLDDEMVSRYHFSVMLKDGLAFLLDAQTRNGTYVNGRPLLERFLEPGDRIKCGSTIFIYFELDEDSEAVPRLIDDEAERNWNLETLRADYSVREEGSVYYRWVLKAILQMLQTLNAISDVAELYGRLLDWAFEVIPAMRSAILLNGHRIGPELDDFTSQVYRLRDLDGPSRFVVSTEILREVYAGRQPVISNKVRPALCAPLMLADTMLGVIYMEGTAARNGFEPEQLQLLKGIAELVVAAIRLAGKFEAIRDARDLLKEQLPSDQEIIGETDGIRRVREQMRRAAQFGATVLITGETGTGKELVARGIHAMSKRAEQPFVAINCGALPDTLLESELFGHVKGAFTGATSARKGHFRMAEGGTAFLDEIGEMNPQAQTRLLRVLQERMVVPLGTEKPVPVDVQVIAATNVDLEQAIAQQRFRQDLFQRLNVLTIDVPPLRERADDIPELTAHFLKKYSHLRDATDVAPEAMDAMMRYSWPGNIRELDSSILSAIINGDSDIILLENLPLRIKAQKAAAAAAGAMPVSLRETGRLAAKEAQKAELQVRLAANGGNVAEAAKSCNISRTYAYRLLKDQ